MFTTESLRLGTLSKEDVRGFYLRIRGPHDKHKLELSLRLNTRDVAIPFFNYWGLKVGEQRIFLSLRKTSRTIPGSYTAYIRAIDLPMTPRKYLQWFWFITAEIWDASIDLRYKIFGIFLIAYLFTYVNLEQTYTVLLFAAVLPSLMALSRL
ncbi:hypothetical protein F4805DRAFT_273916 [Annulohypoxylon moriforme]|nr:hypothetical protein F4805DRAFT_273916 [Annulohypoxylon moriforme]